MRIIRFLAVGVMLLLTSVAIFAAQRPATAPALQRHVATAQHLLVIDQVTDVIRAPVIISDQQVITSNRLKVTRLAVELMHERVPSATNRRLRYSMPQAAYLAHYRGRSSVLRYVLRT